LSTETHEDLSSVEIGYFSNEEVRQKINEGWRHICPPVGTMGRWYVLMIRTNDNFRDDIILS
jgi:hypothetical protein